MDRWLHSALLTTEMNKTVLDPNPKIPACMHAYSVPHHDLVLTCRTQSRAMLRDIRNFALGVD